MIARGVDGTFYEIPDDVADQYKVPPEEVQDKIGKGCGCQSDAQMGMGQEMMGAAPNGGSPQGVVINVFNPTAVQSPMMGQQQGPQPQSQQQESRSFLQGGGPQGLQGQGAGTEAGATCYSCYCYNCYSCYCYSCYCYRTCYSCYVQPV